MSVLCILETPDPRLRLVAEPVAAVDEEVHTLAADMIETMYAANGIGLAAIQVGVQKRVVVVDLQDRADEDGNALRSPRVFINPEIISLSEELSVYNEGCLSIPEQYAEVERPASCRVRWRDMEGRSQEGQLEGLMSTCLQHEIDHLNGILFIDHISRLKRDMVLKKLAKMRKAA